MYAIGLFCRKVSVAGIILKLKYSKKYFSSLVMKDQQTCHIFAAICVAVSGYLICSRRQMIKKILM